MYLKVEILTLKVDLTETPSLGDMDGFTIYKKNQKISNFKFLFFFSFLPAVACLRRYNIGFGLK